MPVYNAQDYLREAVDSILAQTDRDFELLAIDDGSTDTSREILASYDDPRLRIESNEKNLGLIATLNRGLDLARGEFIARMDADDFSLPDRLEKQIALLNRHPDFDAVSARYEFMDPQGQVMRHKHYGIDRPLSSTLVCWSSQFDVPFCHGAAVFRKSFFDRVGRYDPEFSHAEDYELFLRAQPESQLANHPDVLYRVRRHKENVSSQNRDEQIEATLKAIICWHAKFLGETIDERTALFLWHPGHPPTPEAAPTVGRLLERICAEFLANPAYSGRATQQERQWIREDTAIRIALVARRVFWRQPLTYAKFIRVGLRLAPQSFLYASARRCWGKIFAGEMSPIYRHDLHLNHGEE